MPVTKRAVDLRDVAAVMALSAAEPPRAVYKAVERLCKETCGWRLLTILKYVEAKGVVERLSSSDEKSYPVGGTKPLDKLTENQKVLDRGEIFLAATKEDVRKAFFDHELIFSLGITAIMNVPIRHEGRRLGTLNFCGEEGMYGEAEKSNGRILAGLLVPVLLKEMAGK